jgi:hypothetical protein
VLPIVPSRASWCAIQEACRPCLGCLASGDSRTDLSWTDAAPRDAPGDQAVDATLNPENKQPEVQGTTVPDVGALDIGARGVGALAAVAALMPLAEPTTTVVVRARAAAPPPDNVVVSKATEAVALRPKRGRLTLLSRRVYNVLLVHAQRQGVDQSQYSILLGDLIDDARFNSNNTEILKSHLRDMQVVTIEWHSSAGGRQTWQSTQLLGPVKIETLGPGRPCTIYWSFPEPIRERLVRPTQYARFLLEISNEMRSYAAATLYELGAQYLTSPARLTMREDLVWWASVLTGRSDITQVDYRTLHRDTIKKALAELNTLCPDFTMELVEHRRGRRVEELQFRVIPKLQPPLTHLAEGALNTFDLELVDRIVRIGMRRPDAQDLYAVTDEGLLRAAVEHTEQRMKNTTLAQLKSPPAYLRDALKRNYVQPPDGAVAPALPPPPSPQEKIARLREEWKVARTAEARQRFEAMDDAERQALAERFEAERLSELPSAIARTWKNGGPSSRVAGSVFFRWLADDLAPGGVTDAQLLEFAMSRS